MNDVAGSAAAQRHTAGALDEPKAVTRRAYSPAGRALSALGVGETMVWPAKPRDDIDDSRNRATSACAARKPKRFTTSISEENGGHVIRVRRVA